MSTTTTVSLDLTVHLFPVGTVYGGGPTTYRDPDAGPVEETAPRTLDEAIAELGSVGTAIRWALDRGLLAHEGTERDDDPDSPSDDYTFAGGMSLDEWQTFAELYLIEIDADGRPTGTDRTDHGDGTGATYEDVCGPMDWNVGGITKVGGARLSIEITELAAEPADEIDQSKPQARGHLARTGHKLTGYYVPTDDPGIVRLVRTCACAGA